MTSTVAPYLAAARLGHPSATRAVDFETGTALDVHIDVCIFAVDRASANAFFSLVELHLPAGFVWYSGVKFASLVALQAALASVGGGVGPRMCGR